jgi:integrase/recombinase XerD
MTQGGVRDFAKFLADENRPGLTFGQLTEGIVLEFYDYVKQHHRGEGVPTYFKRFKMAINHAYNSNLLKNNSAQAVKTKQVKPKLKPTLTLDELKTLENTPTRSHEVKRAFLFCCLTGLRWADTKALTWDNINKQEKYLHFKQGKTSEEVRVNLNDTACKYLDFTRETTGAPVFNLPSSTGANMALKAWVKRAGIKKAITWHNARHSFSTNLVFYGADVTVASRLLGHASLQHTERLC